jgi:hypothetical protein
MLVFRVTENVPAVQSFYYSSCPWLVISRTDCRAISARRRTTAHFTVVSTVLSTGYVVNKTVSCVLTNHCDFGDNDIITIVSTGLTTKKYVAVLSVLNFRFCQV